jgi:hypothetical protein
MVTKRHEGKNMNNLTKGALAMVIAGSVTFSVANAWLTGQSSNQLAKVNRGNPKPVVAITQAKKTGKHQAPITDVKNMNTAYTHNNAAFQMTLKDGNKINSAAASTTQNSENVAKRAATNLVNNVNATATKPAAPKVPATSRSTEASKTTIATITTAATTKTTNTTSNTMAAKPAELKISPTNRSTKASKTATTTITMAGTAKTTTTSDTTVTKPAASKTVMKSTSKKATKTATTTTIHGKQVSQIEKEKNASRQDKIEKNEKKM